jgi:hypothetical protein
LKAAPFARTGRTRRFIPQRKEEVTMTIGFPSIAGPLPEELKRLLSEIDERAK